MSLTALAHTAPETRPFNANFYIVAATIIPVLFIAIIVQGGGYQEMLRASLNATRRARGNRRIAGLLANLYGSFLQLIAYTILIVGILSEGNASRGLYNERTPSGDPATLFATTLLLLLAAAGLPAITLARTFINTSPRQHRTRRARPERPLTTRPPRISIQNPAPPSMPKWAKRTQGTGNSRNVRGR